jgi:hypothetical protein
MELKGSPPHSQQPATCPYPEPDWSCPCPHHTSQKSILILWSPSLRSPYQNPVCISPLPNTRYMSWPSQSSWFGHPRIRWGVRILKLLVMQSSSLTSSKQPPCDLREFFKASARSKRSLKKSGFGESTLHCSTLPCTGGKDFVKF